MVTAGNGPWWLTTSGAMPLLTLTTLESGTCTPSRPGTKMRLRSDGSRWKRGSTSRIDAVLVAVGVDGGDLALREGVVERAVDVLHVDAEPRGGLAVDLDGGLQPARLAVGRDVDEPRHLLEPVDHLGHPVRRAPRSRGSRT